MLFFLTYLRPSLALVEETLELVGSDGLGNPLGLPAGLGELPLHQDKDGWHSVLGTWNDTSDNPDTLNEAAKADPENNIVTYAALVSPPRNARPRLSSVICHYPGCSGHRLAVSFHSTIGPKLRIGTV